LNIIAFLKRRYIAFLLQAIEFFYGVLKKANHAQELGK
jgi:hypothetical protein